MAKRLYIPLMLGSFIIGVGSGRALCSLSTETIIDNSKVIIPEERSKILDLLFKEISKSESRVIINQQLVDGIMNIDLARAFHLRFNDEGKLVIKYF